MSTQKSIDGGREQMNQPCVVYEPKILRNMAEICEKMVVCPKTVRTWKKNGAPITVEGRGSKKKYSTEAMRLQIWREIFNMKNQREV